MHISVAGARAFATPALPPSTRFTSKTKGTPSSCTFSRRSIGNYLPRLLFRCTLLPAPLLNSQKSLGVAVEHQAFVGIGNIELRDFFRGIPIAEIIGVIGTDHDMIDAAKADQVLDRIEAINHIIVIDIF